MPGIFAIVTRYFHTIRPLRAEQIFYRVYYPLKRLFFIPAVRQRGFPMPNIVSDFYLPDFPRATNCFFPVYNGFCFLNQRIDFGKQINWDPEGLSRLWQFHLYYFDWLRDSQLSESDRLGSMIQFIELHKNRSNFNHSYPTALRIRNWIYFVLRYNIRDTRVDSYLFRDATLLLRFPEYEIGGNHLLEGGLSLLWAGHYFGDSRMLLKAEAIIVRELKRQILSDGSHYERSVGYHIFIQKNIFETILLLKHFGSIGNLYKLLIDNLFLMLSHLLLLKGRSDILPHFGDSNPEMNDWTEEMNSLAQDLFYKRQESDALQSKPLALKLMERNGFRLFFLRGFLLSDDQPGHSHADTFTFCLDINGLPCIVDPGASVYDSVTLRELQRSTAYHNTLEVAGANSSELWGAFRMGRRACVKTLGESDFYIDSEHDGYFSVFGITHRRSVRLHDDAVLISDEWRLGRAEVPPMNLMLHFHPDRRIFLEKDVLFVPDCGVTIRFEGAVPTLESYDYCIGFGKTIKSMKLKARINRNKINTLIERIDGQTH